MTSSVLIASRGKYVTGGIGMLLGPVVVFGIVLLMNRFLNEFDKTPQQAPSEMQVVKQEKPKPEKKAEKPKPKPRPRPSRPAPPVSGLDSSLSGIDMSLLGFGNDMAGIDDSLLGKTETSVMTEDSVDTPPQPKSRGRFIYPASAKKRGVQGFVLLSLLIDVDGSVDKVQVLESSPAGVFDDAAMVGIKSWRFSPAQYQGAPVKVWAKQNIRFSLE
ncbi:MAG: energy transducer TonB [Methylobacter sp.]|nr:energy transducer TonB [Methylobacter sp.]MDP2429081.1 energy transducer TonB [Methylobacter sp.]MDP3054486.1 energy transducer TonB [Methylobacter sp.]MDP3362393.1 energy transducer TonB [Methylobacter sp.]MDZ4218933.1 energy transducer TonB [Methylobacter sp.]